MNEELVAVTVAVYGTKAEAAAELGQHLKRRGLRPRDVVHVDFNVLMLPTRPHYVTAMATVAPRRPWWAFFKRRK